MDTKSKLFFNILRDLQKEGILKDIILIGSWTHHFYRIKLKDTTRISAIRSLDVDFLIPNPPKIKKDVNIQEMLKKYQFKIITSYPTGYTKYQNPELDVEFLISELGPETKSGQIQIDKLHIQANKIRMLNFLQSYTTTVTDKKNNITARVPEPAAYVLHKFIIAQRRTAPAKKEKDLKASEEALRQFQQSKGIIALPEETQKMVDQLVDFETAYQEAVTELKTFQTKLQFLKSQLGDRRKTLERDLSEISTPYIRALRQKVAGSEAALTVISLDASNGQYPDVKREKKKLKVLKETLAREIKKIMISNIPVDDPLAPYQELVAKIIEVETEVEANGARVEKLKEIVGQYSKKMETLPDKSMILAGLERTRKLDENIYLMMKEKYEEARITRAGQIGKARIIDAAYPPEYPISPKKKMNLILGVLIGLGLGVGITFFLEYLDNSIRTVEDLERMKFPLLGCIPEGKPDERNSVWKPDIFTVN